MQSCSPAAAADVDPSAVGQQQQHIPEQRHSSSYAPEEAAAQPSAVATAAAASTQAASHGDRSQQHMQHGIPGFGAMSPAQQSAAILAKWGMQELQMQQQQQQQEQAHQQPQTGNTQLEAAPSSTDSAQQGGPSKLASAADVLDGVTQNTHQARPVGLGGASAPEASLHPALAHDDQLDSMQVQQDSQQPQNMTSSDAGHHHKTVLAAGTQRGNQPQGDTQGSSALVSEHTGEPEGGLAVGKPDGEGSSEKLQQGSGAEGGGDLGSERTGASEVGPVLEQPDGEGPNLLWTPEVVRGRVVRATEKWHRQRIQQEASQQVTA